MYRRLFVGVGNDGGVAVTKSPRVAATADHIKMFLSTIEGFRYQHNIYEVFRDWTELAAAEVHQLPYHAKLYTQDADFARVEANYLEVAKKYSREELDRFGELLGITHMALDTAHQDFLGQCYMQLEINNMRSGQYFTPYHLSLAMVRMTLDDVQTIIDDNGGWFTLLEPACGSGGMLIAAAQILHEKNIHATTSMCFTAIDVDRLCANMTYIQTGLLGLTGIVYHGNTLSMEMQSHRFTPAARLYPRMTNQMMDSTNSDWEPPRHRRLEPNALPEQASLLELA
jgi:hypothetical protein